MVNPFDNAEIHPSARRSSVNLINSDQLMEELKAVLDKYPVLSEALAAKIEKEVRTRVLVGSFNLDTMTWFKAEEIREIKRGCQGIYTIWTDDECLYVGQSRGIRSRLKSPDHPWHLAREFYEKPRIAYFEVTDTKLLIAMESTVIKKLKPAWNGKGNTPKSRIPVREYYDPEYEERRRLDMEGRVRESEIYRLGWEAYGRQKEDLAET